MSLLHVTCTSIIIIMHSLAFSIIICSISLYLCVYDHENILYSYCTLHTRVLLKKLFNCNVGVQSVLNLICSLETFNVYLV